MCDNKNKDKEIKELKAKWNASVTADLKRKGKGGVIDANSLSFLLNKAAKLEVDNKQMKLQLEQLCRASTSSKSKELETSNQQLQKEMITLEEEKLQLQVENHGLRSLGKNQKIAELERFNASLGEERDDLEKEIEQLHRNDKNRQIFELTAEKHALIEQNQDMKTGLDEKAQHLLDLKCKVKTLTEDNEHLQ
jgi:hypothetical protein